MWIVNWTEPAHCIISVGLGGWSVFGCFTLLCMMLILTNVTVCADLLQRPSCSETGLWGRVQYDP